ncbi:MAG: PP2C family protein-serine/threonine phosphatase [Planctomycetes bacterium]|nr:PP2C family protein-serine/threonine phosphatase [Planctomycetota bacterium]
MLRITEALLADLPAVVPGAAVLVRTAGAERQFGGAIGVGQAWQEHRCELPDGEVVASLATADPAAGRLVAVLLDLIEQRERLEGDMESMNTSSLQLLEHVATLNETLPRLSTEADDRAIAETAARACLRATGVQHVFFCAHHQNHGVAEVLAHCAAEGAPVGTPVDTVMPSDQGLLAEVLDSAEGVVFRSVPANGRLGEPGSPEALAQHMVLGVPVAYGTGERRHLLGALLLVDKAEAGLGGEATLGSQEGQAAESFAAMLGAVLGARKTAAFGKELSMAQAIQRQILPERPLQLSGFDIAADYQACGAVGGDYFDYVPMADGRTLVVVADVSGHNLASGMMMVSARATLRTLASVRSEPAAVLADLASAMYGDLTRTERFLTAAGVALARGATHIDYVNAGHNDLLVYRAATDRVERVASDSTILGFLPRPDYRARSIAVAPGDCLLLFTDGVSEAMDQEGEMFGEDRLAALFAQLAAGRTAAGIIRGLGHELRAFQRGRPGGDDVTMVAIRCVADGGHR